MIDCMDLKINAVWTLIRIQVMIMFTKPVIGVESLSRTKSADTTEDFMSLAPQICAISQAKIVNSKQFLSEDYPRINSWVITGEPRFKQVSQSLIQIFGIIDP